MGRSFDEHLDLQQGKFYPPARYQKKKLRIRRSPFCQIAFANELWYSPTIYTTKVSILLLYLRLFRPARALVWSSRILIVLLLFYFVSDLALVFLCNPIRKHWDIETPGHCGNLYLLFIVNGVFSIITDFWILLSPMPVIWHLQMPVKRKIAVTAVFAAGLLYVQTHSLPFRQKRQKYTFYRQKYTLQSRV